MSDLDPAAIRARAALATPGPWATGQPWATVSSGSDSIIHGYYEGWCDSCGDEITTSASVSVEGADAEHIAGMDPTTTLTLLDRLEADEAALERVRNLRDRWHRWVRLAGSMSGALSVPLPDVVSDLSRALDGEATDE